MDLSHRRVFLLVAVAALAVVAGCTGGNGPETATPANNTTAATPANATSGPTVQPLEELNGSYLQNNTRAAVENGGSYSSNTTYYYALDTTLQQGSSWTNSTQRVDLDADRGVLRTTETILGTSPTVTTSTVYTDANGSYRQLNSSQGVTYAMQSGVAVVNLTTFTQNYTFLTAAFAYEANGTASVGDTTTVEYTSTNLTDGSYLGATENVTVSNSTSTLYVDGDGVVRRAHLEYTLVASSGSSRTELTVTLDDIGSTSVDEPDWLPEARGDNTTETGS